MIDKDRYRKDDDYRDATTAKIQRFEDELRRWYYDSGWRLTTADRRTLYGWNDTCEKPRQAMKLSRKDLWFDKGLKRTARINARIEHAIKMFNYTQFI